eukprot:1832201-Pleurochrysis_carterae.AAC.1
MMTLFVVATREGWTTIMWSTVEGYNDIPAAATMLLFVFYVTAMSFVLLNLFAGLICSQAGRACLGAACTPALARTHACA